MSLALQLGSALTERARHEFDAAWVKGIRKGWNQSAKKAKKYPGRLDTASKPDFDKLHKSSVGARSALDDLTSWVRDLRADLLVNKGFWTLRTKTKSERQKYTSNYVDLEALRAKVVEALSQAEDSLTEASKKIGWWDDVLTPGTTHFRLDGGQRRKAAEGDFQRQVNSVAIEHDDAVDTATRHVKRLLGYLRDVLKKMPESTKAIGTYYGGEPDKVKLGKLTVVFSDSPSAGSRPLQLTTPTRTEKELGMQYVRLPMGTGDSHMWVEPRSPAKRMKYIQQFKKTEQLLKRRGLGFLWYGRIEVMCKDCGGTNQYGDHLGVGAHYHRRGDYITFYDDGSSGNYRLIAHEMGHRYYFKFMTATDRANFDKFFGGYPIKKGIPMVVPSKVPSGKVRAVSEYGGVSTAEDFAEVFMHYIDGRGMTRDQAMRMRQFIKSHARKVESASLSANLGEAL